MAIMKVLTGIDLKTALRGAIILAAITLLTMGFRWFTGIQAENRNLVQAVSEYREQVTALETQKANDRVLIDSLQTALETQAEALQMVNDQFSEIRDVREQQKRVLEGSRLGRLAAERAGLIESKSNTATRERMTEFEGVINEDF